MPAETLEVLATLASVEDGWEGPGSLGMNELTRKACEGVLALLPDSCPQPELTLNENGTLTFEWYPDPYIYLEVGATRFALLLREDRGRQMVNGENEKLASAVNELIIPELVGGRSA